MDRRMWDGVSEVLAWKVFPSTEIVVCGCIRGVISECIYKIGRRSRCRREDEVEERDIQIMGCNICSVALAEIVRVIVDKFRPVCVVQEGEISDMQIDIIARSSSIYRIIIG